MTNFDYQVISLILQNRKAEAKSLIFEKTQILSEAEVQVKMWEEKISNLGAEAKPLLIVLESVRQNAKINGIKNLVDKLGMGLKDAKNYYEYLEKQLESNHIESKAEVYSLEKKSDTENSIRAKALNYLKERKKIQAVKFIKETLGMGLRDAINYIDELEKQL